MITIELANELSRRGHEVAVFCPRNGALSDLMLPRGVRTKSRLNEFPWAPDVIHGHHHLPAMAALSYFADAPAIYCCHGVIPWPEQIPSHPRIRKYVVMCEGMIPRLGPMYEISEHRIAALPNFVNTKRFSTVRRPAVRPVRALLFGGGGFSGDELLRLDAACAEHGISLEKVGYSYGNPQARPEVSLPQYDLVFAVGKCAIEAMACGCAVIPIVPGQVGNLITSENFEDWALSNFCPRYFTSSAQISPEWLKSELGRYSPEAVTHVTDRVRSERTLTGAVDRLEVIYSNAIRDYEGTGPAQREREFAPYLEKLSAEADVLWEREAALEPLRLQFETSRAEAEKLRIELGSKEQHINSLHQRVIELQQTKNQDFIDLQQRVIELQQTKNQDLINLQQRVIELQQTKNQDDLIDLHQRVIELQQTKNQDLIDFHQRASELYQANEALSRAINVPSVKYTLRRIVWTIAVKGRTFCARLVHRVSFGNPPAIKRQDQL